jgi:hypothetical protein
LEQKSVAAQGEILLKLHPECKHTIPSKLGVKSVTERKTNPKKQNSCQAAQGGSLSEMQ